MIDLEPAASWMSGFDHRGYDEQLDQPTPCPADPLGDLIEHVGGLSLAFTGRRP